MEEEDANNKRSKNKAKKIKKPISEANDVETNEEKLLKNPPI